MTVVAVLAPALGIAGMLGCWALAWWLVRPLIRPAFGPATQPASTRPSPRPRPLLHDEPTPSPTSALPPPDWLFEDGPQDLPQARARPDSVADTVCFQREQLDAFDPSDPGAPHTTEKTELLPEDSGREPIPPARVSGPNGTELLTNLPWSGLDRGP